MKIKFLSIMMAVAVALAITSCNGNSSTNSTSDSISSVKSEAVEDSTNIIEDKQEASAVSQTEEVKETDVNKPIGDPVKDAKIFAEKCYKLLDQVKSYNDEVWFKTETNKIQKEYEDYYKAKGEAELEKFQNEITKIMNSSEFRQKGLEKKAELEKTMSK